MCLTTEKTISQIDIKLIPKVKLSAPPRFAVSNSKKKGKWYQAVYAKIWILLYVSLLKTLQIAYQVNQSRSWLIFYWTVSHCVCHKKCAPWMIEQFGKCSGWNGNTNIISFIKYKITKHSEWYILKLQHCWMILNDCLRIGYLIR